MKRNLLLLAVFFISTAINGAAQAQFDVGGQSRTLRREGLKELSGVATLKLLGTTSQTITAGSAITFTFNTTIANASAVSDANVTCTNTDCGASNANITTSASNTAATGVITITFKTASTFAAGDTLVLSGIRVNANAVAPGSSITATAGATFPPGGVVISFSDNPAIVGSVFPNLATTIGYGATTDASAIGHGAVSILTCVPPGAPPAGPPPPASFTINVAENFPNALTSLSDESAPPNAPAATTGSNVFVSFSNVPKDVTIAPQTPVPCPTEPKSGCGITFAGTPASQTATSAAQTLTFTYVLTTTNTGAIEDMDLNFLIGTSDATLATGQATPSVATVSLYPQGTSDTPLFTGPEGSLTAMNISDCITYLLLPWVSNFQVKGSTHSSAHYDTGIVVSNTTLDPFAATGGSALPQTGTCSLTMYPDDGTAALPFVSAAVAPGTSLVYTASSAYAGKSGYVIGSCNFQNAHTYVNLVDNAGLGDPKTSQGYLGLVIPNPSLTPRNPAGGGFGESLGH